MKDITFTCPITQEYVNDLLTECFDYQSVKPSVGSDGKYHWIYIIINKTNGRFFIGKRSKLNCLTGPNVSRQQELQEDYQKLGPNAFLRYDLSYYNSYDEMMMAVEDMFGDDFMEVFCEQLGTCYNSRSLLISTKQYGEDVSSSLELVKPVEGSKPIDTIDFTNSKKFFHHWMTRKDEAVCVPNAECLKYIENGFVFRCKQIKLYKDGVKMNPTISSKRYNDENAAIEFAQRVLHLCARGWSLAKDWDSAISFRKSRQEKEKKKANAQSVPDVKPIQLSLDLEAKQPEVKQPEVKQPNLRSKNIRTIIVQKDGYLKSIFIEEVISYLRQGYVFVQDTIRIKRGEHLRAILMTSQKKYAQSDEDKLSMRKIKSLQVLAFLENGWEAV